MLSSPTPILVLDFDGTLCLGDDPILLYADEVARRVDTDAGEQLHAELTEFLSGARRLDGVDDGYHAVVQLSLRLGIERSAMRAAYTASRERMAAGEGSMRPPEGIRELLDDVRAAGVRTVLVTNAPVTGATSWLEGVGIGERLDAVIPNAGKPGRMQEHLRALLAEAAARECPQFLVSVGDVWVNDVQPALEIGAQGLYIDRYGSGRGPSTASASCIEDLYPALRSWAADPVTAIHADH